MPTFYFNLRSDKDMISDVEGAILPDETAARQHAGAIAEELMRNRTSKTRYWRLDVQDEHRQTCFNLLLADVDETLTHLNPELRKRLDVMSAKTAALADSIAEARLAVQRARAAVMRSRQGLHLASTGGRRLND